MADPLGAEVPPQILSDEQEINRGLAAIARQPAAERLTLLKPLEESRRLAEAELRGQMDYIERLRWETEEMLTSGIGPRLGARVLAAIPSDPPPPLLIGRLAPEGHTILYGPGGSSKGTIACWWIVQLVRAGHRVLICDYENHPAEWASRIDALGGRDAAGAVLHVAPLTAEWQGRRGPLWEQADDLRALADDWGATVLVPDSIVMACGGADVDKPDAAARYAAALELIGRRTLSLAHTPKSEDLRYPFGSAFWHNLARITWSLKRDGEAARLRLRKANAYPRGARYMVEVIWRDGRPVEVWERPESVVLADRIAELLAEQPLTEPAIVQALNAEGDDEADRVRPDSVKKALRRGETGDRDRPARFRRQAGRWELIEP